METSAHAVLSQWENFYVIVGSSAGGLTGLMFVVVALVAESSLPRTPDSMNAFGTPNVIHFLATLVIAAVLSVPWQRLKDPAHVIGFGALAGIVYVLVVLRRVVGAEVLCIEESHDSARLGLLNARLNGVEARVRYIARPVEQALAALAAAGSVDAAVLDPPRAGCASSVTGWLALAGPPRIVYVSCDPATLARDLRLLSVSGPYTVERMELVDMFPQTHHVEALVLLRRG